MKNIFLIALCLVTIPLVASQQQKSREHYYKEIAQKRVQFAHHSLLKIAQQTFIPVNYPLGQHALQKFYTGALHAMTKSLGIRYAEGLTNIYKKWALCDLPIEELKKISHALDKDSFTDEEIKILKLLLSREEEHLLPQKSMIKNYLVEHAQAMAEFLKNLCI